jgi:hypothetical protein
MTNKRQALVRPLSVMDRQTRQQRESEGWEVRAARADRRERGGRTVDQAGKLIYQAAKDCSICAVCFQPLALSDSATMEWWQFGLDPLPEHVARGPRAGLSELYARSTQAKCLVGAAGSSDLRLR